MQVSVIHGESAARIYYVCFLKKCIENGYKGQGKYVWLQNEYKSTEKSFGVTSW